MNVNKSPMNVCHVGILGLTGACIGMLLSVQAHALSLGSIQVDSALDEPLRAEIPLQSVDDEALDSLEVTLGTEQDFARAEVPRSDHLRQLEFTVSTEGGEPVVIVTTEQPVKEPFLHFLIAAEWSGGKLVREYTGLLDPPLYTGDAPGTVASPEAGEMGTMPSTGTESIAGTPESTSSSPSVSVSSAAGRSAEYGPTQEGDTLWDIASKLDTGAVQANVFQVMIALLRQNPEAFIDNNVNRLKTGQTLQLQDISLIAEVSPEEASRIYTAQLDQWQSYKTQIAQAGGEPTVSGETTAEAGAEQTGDDSAAAETTEITVEGEDAVDQAGAGEGEDVLRIVQADTVEAGESEGASAGNDNSGELAELQSQIASLEESLESRTLENEELRERVRMLETQLQNAQRLVEIESQELAAAQQQAAAQEGGADMAATGSPEASSMPEQDTPGAQASEEAATVDTTAGQSQETAQAQQVESEGQSGETQSGQQAAATGAASQQAAASTESNEKVRKVASRPPQTPWWTRIPDLVFSSWIWMVGAGAGVLVLVLGLLIFMRRRQSIAEFEESILSGSALDSYSETTDSAAASASDTSFLSDFGTAGMGTMQADEVDPLAEAEVYLAYGRDEQAEDVLKEAARRDPERSEIKLKLMEIYKQREDVKAFETLAEELYPAGDQADPEVWRQVTQMGRELNPGNPLFQDSAAAGTDTETGDQSRTTVDQAPAAAATQASSQAQAPPQQETARRAPPPASEADTLDFNLDDLDMDEGTGRSTETASAAAGSSQTAASEAEGPDLSDFQLDFDSEPETTASGDDNSLDFGDELLQQPAGNVDPSEQPFPAPDQQADLDRELERLASERETVTAEVSGTAAGSTAGDGEQTSDDDDNVSWETAETQIETLDFPASDSSEIEFDLNLDDSSVQHGSGEEATQAAPSGGTTPGGGETPEREAGEGLLEFESDNIPPQETWAVPSSDASPGNGEDSVSYDPTDDVQSAVAPPYNEAETKLDLARAYMDMGDKVGARSIIDEVMREGDPSQRDRAAELASQL